MCLKMTLQGVPEKNVHSIFFMFCILYTVLLIFAFGLQIMCLVYVSFLSEGLTTILVQMFS
jgi:hypothetical protein